MGVSWKGSRHSIGKGKGPAKTRGLTKLSLMRKGGEEKIVDKDKNEYSLDQAKELIKLGIAYTENTRLIEILSIGEI